MNTLLKTSAVAVLLACISFLYAEEPKAYFPGKTTTTTESSETFLSRVLRVHHFVEADFEYIAYTINWRGHEVVVPASYTDEIVKEGDSIRCQMQSISVNISEGEKAKITFSMISSQDLRDAEKEAAKLKMIRAEVERRRAIREGTSGNVITDPGAKQLEKNKPDQSL